MHYIRISRERNTYFLHSISLIRKSMELKQVVFKQLNYRFNSSVLLDDNYYSDNYTSQDGHFPFFRRIAIKL